MFSFVCLESLRKLTTWRKPTTILSTNQYILSYTQYTAQYTHVYHPIHVHTGASPNIQVWLCISQYILVWTRTYWYKTVYTRMNYVYLGTSPYIRVYTHMKHFAKRCMVQGFEPLISCILNVCMHICIPTIDLMHTDLMLFESWYFSSPPYDISKTDWDLGMPLHVTCWLVWCQLLPGAEPDEPLVLTLFWRCVSSLNRPGRRGPVANECYALSLGPEGISESETLRAVGLCKITETIHLLMQMCTSHKTRCKTY